MYDKNRARMKEEMKNILENHTEISFQTTTGGFGLDLDGRLG
jgi:hypothetical protein